MWPEVRVGKEIRGRLARSSKDEACWKEKRTKSMFNVTCGIYFLHFHQNTYLVFLSFFIYYLIYFTNKTWKRWRKKNISFLSDTYSIFSFSLQFKYFKAKGEVIVARGMSSDAPLSKITLNKFWFCINIYWYYHLYYTHSYLIFITLNKFWFCRNIY